MNNKDLKIIKKIIWLRIAQIIVNERYKNGDFLIPIHLAFGHESIAVAVDEAIGRNDSIFLTHRNIHYNLARSGTLKHELDEYYLKKSGLSGGMLGSMNMTNLKKNVIYSSSILGNNLSVGSGFALGNKVKKINGMVYIVTGDGAIEEGSFYESLLFLKSNNLPSVIIVENNGWSLGTRIEERRANIDLCKLANSLDINYASLDGNNPFEYIHQIKFHKSYAEKNNTPVLVEVKLTTLGYWYLKTNENPKGKFINYHAGPAPEINEQIYPVIDQSDADPLHVLEKFVSREDLKDMSKNIQESLKVEIL